MKLSEKLFRRTWRGDWLEVGGNPNALIDHRAWLCGDGVEGVVAVPREATLLRVELHNRPAADRVPVTVSDDYPPDIRIEGRFSDIDVDTECWLIEALGGRSKCYAELYYCEEDTEAEVEAA